MRQRSPMPSVTRRASAWRRRSRASTWRGSPLSARASSPRSSRDSPASSRHAGSRWSPERDGWSSTTTVPPSRSARTPIAVPTSFSPPARTREPSPASRSAAGSSPAKRRSRSQRCRRRSSSSAAGSSASSSRARGDRWVRRSRSSRRSTTSCPRRTSPRAKPWSVPSASAASSLDSVPASPPSRRRMPGSRSSWPTAAS